MLDKLQTNVKVAGHIYYN